MSQIVIKTQRLCPPIPSAKFDWIAWIDGHEPDEYGHGATEQAAIDNLKERLALNGASVTMEVKLNFTPISTSTMPVVKDLRSPNVFVICKGKIYSGYFHCNGFFYTHESGSKGLMMIWDKKTASQYDGVGKCELVEAYLWQSDVTC